MISYFFLLNEFRQKSTDIEKRALLGTDRLLHHRGGGGFDRGVCFLTLVTLGGLSFNIF